MIRLGWIIAVLSLAVLSGCEPGSSPADVSAQDYDRHKANRQAYMYQGL